MGVNKNTTVLFREIQEEGRKLLAMGVNPKVCCTNREHQKVVEKRVSGIEDHKERGHRTSDVTKHELLCDIHDAACELTEIGAGKVKIGCLDIDGKYRKSGSQMNYRDGEHTNHLRIQSFLPSSNHPQAFSP